MEHSDSCLYNAYLLNVLQKRSLELKAAYQHITQLDCRAHSVNTDAFVQTYLDTEDATAQTLQSSVANECDECSVLRETVWKLNQQLNDSVQSVTDRDSELAGLKKQLIDSANLISELRARADAEEAARKVKEEQVEELEELVVVCKSESLATEQEQHTMVENSSRENESLKSELNALNAVLQAKEEALAQNVFEKDDLEDTNSRVQATNMSLQNQLDELRLQLKNQNSQFEAEIQHLVEEKQQLMEKVQNLSTELTRCEQSVSLPFGCSQSTDLLASQQSNELSAVKLELLTVQAEKDDLIQQLQQCKAELSSLQLHSRQSVQQSSQNNVASSPIFTKPPSTVTSRKELESQNAALLGQLLILEDQLSESEVLLQESRASRQQSADQLKTALKDLTDFTSRVAGLEREKFELETELNAAKMSLETSEVSLQESKTQLSLVEGKLSSAGNRQRQLMHQKQLLESQNCELLRNLQQKATASTQHIVALPSHCTSVSNIEHISSNVAVKENQGPYIDKLPGTTESFQRCGNRQVMLNGTSARRSIPAAEVENKVCSDTAISTSVDRRLVPCTTSPAALMAVCETPPSVRSEDAVSGNTSGPLKRRTVDCNADTDRKRHLLNVSNQLIG